MALEDRLWTVEQRQRIKELKYRYARAVDDQAWDEWVECFTEDVVCNYEGWGEFEGRERVSEFAADVLDPFFEYTAHLMQQPVITVDGETASGTWYVEIVFATPEGEGGWRQGRYTDSYRLVDDEWKISEISHEFYGLMEFESESVDHEKFGSISKLRPV